jgi:hypothetical protein
MNRFRPEEPPLEEMLDDPIVRLVMRRDGIGPDEVLSTLEGAYRRLRSSGRAPDARDCVLPAGI